MIRKARAARFLFDAHDSGTGVHTDSMLFPVVWNSSDTAIYEAKPALEIWTRDQASRFTESTPLGNGRVGAMVFGGVDHEKVVLNESTMWSGSPQEADRAEAHEVLPEIRNLLLTGQNRKAQDLLQATFVCKGSGSGSGGGKDVPYGCYQVFGNLDIDLPAGPVAAYRRSLDLETAVASIDYRQGDVWFHREAFVSAPAQSFVYHFSASKARSVTFTARVSRPERSSTRSESGQWIIEGQLASGTSVENGVKYCGRMLVTHTGGRVSIDEGGIHVKDADEATIIFSAATTMFGRSQLDSLPQVIERASHVPYDHLKSQHTKDYQKFFKRVALKLPEGTGSRLPTVDRLIASQSESEDPSLAALYFNFGRYLLISSSRPDSPLPSNLQGIWAEELQTPWNADFHLDINVQMNYWPAEVCNLSDCHGPLLKFVPKLVPNGEKTARAYYGARGWVAHVITNPWMFTSPGEGADWGSTCSGAGWLCEHLWSHYEFTRDRRYLGEVYPVIKGATEFFLDMLIEEPKHHWLVTAPSNSPENSFVHPIDGPVTTCMGPTIDNQIVRELFSNFVSASEILKSDDALRDRTIQAMKRLPPTQVGSHGQIMEWLEDYAETDVHHRHVSCLYGLYPSNQIEVDRTPELAAAARTTLERRGDQGTGWSLAWKVCFWARLWDGDHAWKLLKRLFKPVDAMGYNMSNGGGTYPNLFDAHPPFQIDGNFGATAGIAEMLVQSRPGLVRLLPALPAAWASEGSVRGLKAKGGLTVDVAWKDGHVVSHRVIGPGSKTVKVVFGNDPAAS